MKKLLMKPLILSVGFLLLGAHSHAEEGGAAADAKAGASLPNFGDHELEIYRINGYIDLFVPPSLGDTSNLNQLNMKSLEGFLTFTRKTTEPDEVKSVPLVASMNPPKLVIHDHGRGFNKYMVRSKSEEGAVEIHITERIFDQSREKEYYVVVIQTDELGMFSNLIVLGSRGEKSTFMKNMLHNYGPRTE